MDLTLVGTSHFDLDGYRRLSALLKYFRPTTIAVESTRGDFEEESELVSAIEENFDKVLNRFKREFPESHGDTLESWLNSAVFYENRAVVDYMKESPCNLVLSDSSQILSELDHEEVPDQISRFLSQPLQRPGAK